MSSAILRRNSSKQGLQNLLRVTAQRSVEDAEEIERERRRRAREVLRKEHSFTGSAGSPQDGAGPSEECLYKRDLKPGNTGLLDEDEGFSDWTHRAPDKGVRACQDSPREADVQAERAVNGADRRGEKITSTAPNWQHKESHTVEDVEDHWQGRKSSEKRMEFGKRTSGLRDREAEEWKAEVTRVNKTREEEPAPNTDDKVKEKRKDIRVSYTSKVVLQQDRVPGAYNKGPAGEEVTSQLFKTRVTTSRIVGQAPEPREQAEAGLETEQRLEKIRRIHQERESQELEQLRQRQVEAEVELEELKRRREERRRFREEEERKREEEEQHRMAKEEEERRQMKEDIERRRMEAAERRLKTLSTSSPDGDETFNPLSPKSSTFKTEHEERLTAENTCSITERTESLNRSLKKSNSFKKTQPPVLLSKIDDKLEQYTHAVESSSKEPKATKSGTADVPSVPELVSAKKNLFEAGEAWTLNAARCTPTKETDGLKVGVADLITQWVKGSPEGANRNMPAKPSDVKAGDVLQKKNMWEIIGEASAAGCTSPAGKGTSSSKRYKFVVTGHGKYEKISIDDDHYSDYSNGKSGDLCQSDL
ncbi:non-muscle caldesmon isoform X1 [Electrophorus electricus]|uniref:non-muscle caldesmon isoform X1 n=1 Tax=Electrophorus electricus TaxID=8005 RepID=UPI0015CFB805|nr:non-muscle caldesmon isoform X1 [Electrophorus electricus]